ncbi:putative transcription regulator Others family [Helianthus anomalus]
MYRKEHKGINEAYSEVATLFDDHPDLLDEFTRFLPTAYTHHASLRHPYLQYNERSSVVVPLRPVLILTVLNAIKFPAPE